MALGAFGQAHHEDREVLADLIARDADAEHPIDPHAITIAVVRIRAQADMMAKGLTE